MVYVDWVVVLTFISALEFPDVLGVGSAVVGRQLHHQSRSPLADRDVAELVAQPVVGSARQWLASLPRLRAGLIGPVDRADCGLRG